jgi:RND family efflux transporter MFP subunit
MKWIRGLLTLGKWVVGLGLLVLIVASLAGVFHEKIEPGVAEPEPMALEQPFEPGRVERIEEPLIERYPGTVAAKHQTAVSSRILATIEGVRVRAGDTVASGSALVILDARDLAARVSQAEETLSAARAQLAEASADFLRSKELFSQGVMPQSRFDQSERAYLVALSEVDRAREGREEARVAQSYTRIESPIDGRVIDRSAEPGDTAVPGVPLLKLYNPKELRIEAPIRESRASDLEVGQKILVAIDALGRTLEGTLEEKVPQADPGSRSFLAKIRLPEDELIYPGMFGRVLIEVGTRENLYLPTDAVRSVGQIDYVATLREGKPESIRFVKLGEGRQEGLVEVLTGLESGEEVAVFSR